MYSDVELYLIIGIFLLSAIMAVIGTFEFIRFMMRLVSYKQKEILTEDGIEV